MTGHILTLERRKDTWLVIALREYRGSRFLDLRIHFTAADGSLRPTARGATIPLEELTALKGAIEKAIAMVEADGRGAEIP